MTKKEKEILNTLVTEEVSRTIRRGNLNEAIRKREARINRLTECAMKRIQRKGNVLRPKDITEAIVTTIKEARYGETRTPQDIYREYQNMRSHSFISPDETTELGIVYDPDTNELYSGFISNAGCNKQWVIDYDPDFSMDENLQTLYDKICDEWDYQS